MHTPTYILGAGAKTALVMRCSQVVSGIFVAALALAACSDNVAGRGNGTGGGRSVEQRACTDGVHSYQETSVDCGGPVCAACSFFETCVVDSDCQSGVCKNGSCEMLGFTVRIILPNGNTSILSGVAIDLEAEFLSAGFRVNPETVTWTSNQDNQLGAGNPLLDVTLSDGTHTIRVDGTSNSRTVSAQVTVTVTNIEVRILKPTLNSSAEIGSNVQFKGSAAVGGAMAATLVSGAPLVGERKASYDWVSSLDGNLGSVDDLFVSSLSVGQHEITLTVTDNLSGTNAVGSASLMLTITPLNNGPTVVVASPANCPVDLEQGQALDLTGSATDVEDGTLTGYWIDSITGMHTVGDGTSIDSSAAIGKHALTYSATDSAGETSSITCDVYVVMVGGTGTRQDLFPSTTTLNGALFNNQTDIQWIGGDANGYIWVGTTEGLTVFDNAGSFVGEYSGLDLMVGLGNTVVTGVEVIGNVAFISTADGLAKCDYAAAVLSNCAELSAGNFAGIEINGTANDYLVAAPTTAGLFMSSYVGGALVSSLLFNTDTGGGAVSGLPENTVLDVLFVGDTLYVATNEGGLCVAPNPAAALADPTNVDLCASIVGSTLDSVAGDVVTALAWDGTFLWIGTGSGVVRYDPSDDTMLTYDKNVGLVDNKVNDVVIDAAGIVWVATERGVSRITPSTNAITNFAGADFGTGTDLVNAIFIDANDTKWFATAGGVVQYSGT